MRKKSHISLAKYIVNSLDDKELKKHRLSFYIGSVLPDIKPSFVYKRHEINGTFPYVKKHIARLSEGQKVMNKKGGKYSRDLDRSVIILQIILHFHTTKYIREDSRITALMKKN